MRSSPGLLLVILGVLNVGAGLVFPSPAPKIAAVADGITGATTSLEAGREHTIWGSRLSEGASMLTTVSLDGRPVEVSYAAPGQLNFALPADLEVGTYSINVTSARGQTRTSVTVAPRILGVRSSDGSACSETGPCRAGILFIRTVGLRQRSVGFASCGRAAPIELEDYSVLVNETAIPICNLGRDQITIFVPGRLVGPVALTVRGGSVRSFPFGLVLR